LLSKTKLSAKSPWNFHAKQRTAEYQSQAINIT